MSYRLRVLSSAYIDIESTYGWIQGDSPDGAERWYAAFIEAAERVQASPFMWPLAPENELVPATIRVITFGTPRGRTYHILYTVVEDEVRVLRVRGPGQNRLQHLDPFVDD